MSEPREKVVFKSGASSRSKKHDYRLTPRQLIQFATDRFQYGIDKGHARFNWQSGKDDPEFIADRANHGLEHLMKVIDGSGTINDLKAAICNLAMMAWWHENGTGLKEAFPNLYDMPVPVLKLDHPYDSTCPCPRCENTTLMRSANVDPTQ